MQTEMLPNNPRQRGEILLQKYFDCEMTSEEESELLALLGNDQAFKQEARKSYQVESQFRFLSMLKRKPLRVELPHQSPLIFSLPEYGFLHEDESATFQEPQRDVPSAEPFSLESLNMDELIRWAAESPSLPYTKQTETTFPEPKKSAARHRKTSKFEKRFPLPWIAALCLVALFGFLIYQEFQPKQEEVGQVAAITSLARVTHLAEPVFPEDAPIFKRDQQVDDESIRLLSGSLELQLNSGVRIVLVGPVTFNVQSPTTTFCELGRVSVEVPKGAEGFEVQTPFANVRDLGTEFVVDVSDTESAVHVIRGKVAVDKLTDVWVPVVEGVGRIVDSAKSEKQIKADKSLFVAAAMMQQASRHYETRLFSSWNVQRQRRAADPGTIFQLDFEEDAPEKGLVQKVGCRQATGRWSGKKAVVFSKSRDTIRLSAPTRRKSFTLSASICLRNFSQASNAIFSVGDIGPGAIHWQINRIGEIQLLLGEPGQEGLTDYSSSPVISPRQQNVWLNLTTTFDAENRRIIHYLDGKKVAEFPWKEPTDFDFSESELGNWSRQDRAPTDRFFNGRIDEFFLLDHAVSPEKLQSFLPTSKGDGK